jgi:hypothetical protein
MQSKDFSSIPWNYFLLYSAPQNSCNWWFPQSISEIYLLKENSKSKHHQQNSKKKIVKSKFLKCSFLNDANCQSFSFQFLSQIRWMLLPKKWFLNLRISTDLFQ